MFIVLPSHFCGDIADSTNMSMTTSILPGGGSGIGVAVTSHRKAWHVFVSYNLFSCRQICKSDFILLLEDALAYFHYGNC